MSSNAFFVVVLKKHLQSDRVHACDHEFTTPRAKNNARAILHLSFVILSNCHNIYGIYNCRQNSKIPTSTSKTSAHIMA